MGNKNEKYLTYWDRDKMAAIYAYDIVRFIFFNGNAWISI